MMKKGEAQTGSYDMTAQGGGRAAPRCNGTIFLLRPHPGEPARRCHGSDALHAIYSSILVCTFILVKCIS